MNTAHQPKADFDQRYQTHLKHLKLKGLQPKTVRHRVHIRDSKGNRDRFVPLPEVTLSVLRRFWKTHHNPELLFPNRQGGLSGARSASTPLDRGGVQKTLHQVTIACGLKKRSLPTAFATAMQPI